MPSSRLTEKDARRYLFLAQRRGDAAGVARYEAALVSRRGGPSDAEPVPSSAPDASGPISGFRRKGSAGGGMSGITRFYDEHPKIILGTTVAASAIGGIKLNQAVGATITPLELQPSSVAGLGLLAVGLITRQMDMKRTSNLALAAALGQGIATVNEHVPGGGLMSPKKSPVV